MIKECDYLLIGGGIGGYNATKRLRRRAPEANIVMIGRDRLPPYDLPPLSKEVIRREKAVEDLVYPPVQDTGDGTFEQLLGTSAVELDADAKLVRTDSGESFRYGQALLATGSAPIRLDMPGGELGQVFYLRSADDAERIAAHASPGRRAVVVGAGFIGVELAASLRTLGVEVTVVEAGDRLWPRAADPALSHFVQGRLEDAGVAVRLNECVTGVEGTDGVSGVATASEVAIPCDFVCIGIGARPNVELARSAGLQCADGVVVDAHMRTSAPDIYAVGDAAFYPDPYLGRSTRAEHWGHAEYSGQIAAMNMLGEVTAYNFLNYVWSNVFDLHVESAGHPHGHDLMVARRDPSTTGFTHLYFREHVLVGYTAVNGEQSEFPAYRRLIKGRRSLACPTDLADPQVQARTLVTA